jgi:hypothetical protein
MPTLERKNIYHSIEIKNIHTNTAYPGCVYAEVWIGGELCLAATLDLCCERVERVAGIIAEKD